MRYKILELNKTPPLPDFSRILTCLDFKSFYPNIRKATVKTIFPKLIMESKLNFNVIDWQKLSIAVKLLANTKTIRKYQLKTIVPTRSLDICGSPQPVTLSSNFV